MKKSAAVNCMSIHTITFADLDSPVQAYVVTLAV